MSQFRFWYNHIHPHPYLHGWTPNEAWIGTDPATRKSRSISWFSAWDGLLQGYHIRR